MQQKRLFKYDFTFSQEIFKILSRDCKDALNDYYVESCGEVIKGLFYAYKLVGASSTKETCEGEKYLYISFKNYPSSKKCNHWVLKSDVIDV